MEIAREDKIIRDSNIFVWSSSWWRFQVQKHSLRPQFFFLFRFILFCCRLITKIVVQCSCAFVDGQSYLISAYNMQTWLQNRCLNVNSQSVCSTGTSIAVAITVHKHGIWVNLTIGQSPFVSISINHTLLWLIFHLNDSLIEYSIHSIESRSRCVCEYLLWHLLSIRW